MRITTGRPAPCVDPPCVGCFGRLVPTEVKNAPGLYRWVCPDCGHSPRQWWPVGRGLALVGAPLPVSSLDRPNPRFLGASDGRPSTSSELTERYQRDPEWVQVESTRFDPKRVVFA